MVELIEIEEYFKKKIEIDREIYNELVALQKELNYETIDETIKFLLNVAKLKNSKT